MFSFPEKRILERALFLPGPTVAEVRGSIGGVVYARNASGAYMRNKSIPVNPNSVRQQAVRETLSQCAQYYSDTLTSTQIDQWEIFSAGTPGTNKVGQTITLSGIAMFTKINAIRLQGGLAILPVPPAIAGEAIPVIPLVAGNEFDETGQNFTVTAATDLVNWDPDADDDHVLFYQGQPVDPNIRFFKGPWRYLGIVSGDSVTPETFPFTLSGQYAVQENQQCYLKVRHLDPESKVSSESIISTTVAA